jgi:hypothetical protein
LTTLEEGRQDEYNERLNKYGKPDFNHQFCF